MARWGFLRAAFALLAPALTSCASRPSVAQGDRLSPLQHTLSSLGLTPLEPVQLGTIAAGKDEHFLITLPASCITIVATADPGAQLGLELRDEPGKLIAFDPATTNDASVHACLDHSGKFDLTVRSLGRGAAFSYQAWAGASARGVSLAPPPDASADRIGACDAPLPLGVGLFRGSVRGANAEHMASCRRSGGAETVYELRVRSTALFHFQVTPSHFDSILYIRKGACGDSAAEVACNDDPPSGVGSRLDTVLEPGSYFVFVDSYDEQAGDYLLTVREEDAAPIASVCARPPQLSSGILVGGSTVGAAAFSAPLCAAVGRGMSAVYQFEVATTSRVRVEELSTEFPPAFTVRKSCMDPSTEVACAAGDQGRTATYTGMLSPGSYSVFASSRDPAKTGRFSLSTTVAELSSVWATHSLSAPPPLDSRAKSVVGDTLLASDDFTGRCSQKGAPDVAYHLDVDRKSRLLAWFVSHESGAVFSLLSPSSRPPIEHACGTSLDTVVAPGGYTLLVDGTTEAAFGRYEFGWKMRGLTAQDAACRDAKLLTPGVLTQGSTSAAGDKFTTTCGGREELQEASDRVYKLVRRTRSKVRLWLTTPTWDGVLSLRALCEDHDSGARGSELACNDDSGDSRHSKIETTLDPGTYYVVVDGRSGRGEGAFSLEYKELP